MKKDNGNNDSMPEEEELGEKFNEEGHSFKSEDFPIVILGGYGSSEAKERAFSLSVGHLEDGMETFSPDVESLDSPITVPFIDSDSGKPKEVTLPYGVVAVFGSTGSGKTSLLKYLHNYTKGEYVRFMEPELPAMTNPHLLMDRIERFLKDHSLSVLEIDSIRFMIYNPKKKSAAGKGGVSTGIYGDLTALSIVAAKLRKTIIVVVNPTTDDDAADIMARGIEGSISGIFVAQRYGACKFTARTDDNMRVPRRYDYTPGDKVAINYRAKSTVITFDHDDSNKVADLVATTVGRSLLKKY